VAKRLYEEAVGDATREVSSGGSRPKCQTEKLAVNPCSRSDREAIEEYELLRSPAPTCGPRLAVSLGNRRRGSIPRDTGALGIRCE
jgi:hypothetical protein